MTPSLENSNDRNNLLYAVHKELNIKWVFQMWSMETRFNFELGFYVK